MKIYNILNTDYHFFFHSDSIFSQWYPSKFYTEGMWFDNAEHYMMWRKASLFGDQEARSKLIFAPNPKEAKVIGRSIKNFDERIWNEVKRDIVFAGNLAKFTYNESLGKELIKSTAILVEASPYDKIWGIGLNEEKASKTNPYDWPGQNLLGKAIMKVRDALTYNVD